MTTALSKCWLWIAHYGPALPLVPAAWRGFTLWQYTGGNAGMQPTGCRNRALRSRQSSAVRRDYCDDSGAMVPWIHTRQPLRWASRAADRRSAAKTFASREITTKVNFVTTWRGTYNRARRRRPFSTHH